MGLMKFLDYGDGFNTYILYPNARLDSFLVSSLDHFKTINDNFIRWILSCVFLESECRCFQGMNVL